MSQPSILTIAVAIFVGTAITDFFKAINRDLVTPVVAGLVPGSQQSLEKVTVQMGHIKVNIGSAISATLTLIIALFVVAWTLPYLREYSPVRGGSK